MACLPGKALIISASMGDGHNAAADAIAEAIEERWPHCVIERQDTMALRGEGFARWAERSYEAQLSSAPWTYAVSYKALARSSLLASLTKRSVGAFFGPPMERVLRASQPDVVISTYPFGTAAMNWARSKGVFDGPIVAYVPAFHVHPTWAYPGVDLHFVMYASAACDARTPGFELSMRLGAPTVRSGFGRADRLEARSALGLAGDSFAVLVTGGAWGLGGIEDAVRALAGMGGRVRVVAVCGRNRQLEQELSEWARARADVLRVFGYVENMPELMAAADVVVTNGAGNTVLEALRTGRPVIAFSPLAGHGTASTAELVRRQLALEASDVPALVRQVERLTTERELLLRMTAVAQSWGEETGDLRQSLAQVAELWQRHTGRALAGSRSAV